MGSAVNELLVALQAHLRVDAALGALIGPDGLRDRRVLGLDLPALLLGNVEARDFSTASEAGLECLLTLEAWSAVGRREVEAVADAVRGLLDDAELSLPAHRLVSLRHRRTVSRREVKTGFFVAEMSFRAVVE